MPPATGGASVERKNASGGRGDDPPGPLHREKFFKGFWVLAGNPVGSGPGQPLLAQDGNHHCFGGRGKKNPRPPAKAVPCQQVVGTGA